MIRQHTGASFVGWEQERNKFRLKIIHNKTPIYFDIQGTPSDVTVDNYLDLLKSIKNGG